MCNVIYLFASESGRDPGISLFEGFLFRCLTTGVVNSVPTEPVPYVDKVLIVDIMEFSRTFTDWACVSEIWEQYHMSLVVRKPVSRSDTNQAVQPQKIVRDLKFGI